MVRRTLILFWISLQLYQYASAQQRNERSLEEVFEKTLKNHLSLKINEGLVNAANEEVLMSQQSKLPEISIVGEMSYMSNTEILDKRLNHYSTLQNIHFGNSLGAEISQIIYNGKKIRYTISENKLQSKKAIENFRKTQQEVKLLVAKYYINLYKSELKDSIYSQNIRLAENRLEITNTMYKNGTVTHDDVLKAELQLSELRLESEKNQTEQEIIRNELFIASGISNIRTLHSELENVHLHLHSLPDYIIDAHKVSPVVKMQEADLKMEQNRLKIEKTTRQPSIYGFADISMNSPLREVEPQLNKYAGFWNVGIGIQYNLSDLFKSRIRIKRQKYQIDIAENQLDYAVLKLENEVKGSYLRYSITKSQIETRTKNVESAKESYRITARKYDAQLALFLELFNASNTLLDSELKKASTVADTLYLYYELLFTIGNI